MKKAWFLLFFIFLLCACQSVSPKHQISKDYPQIDDENHLFEETFIDEVLSKLDHEDSFVLVMGFKSCPWCQALMPHLNTVGKETGHEVIYYLDIKVMRDDKTSNDHEKYLALEKRLSEVKNEERNTILAPTMVVINQGRVENFHVATVPSHQRNENNILPPLTTEQIQELRQILTEKLTRTKN